MQVLWVRLESGIDFFIREFLSMRNRRLVLGFQMIFQFLRGEWVVEGGRVGSKEVVQEGFVEVQVGDDDSCDMGGSYDLGENGEIRESFG